MDECLSMIIQEEQKQYEGSAIGINFIIVKHLLGADRSLATGQKRNQEILIDSFTYSLMILINIYDMIIAKNPVHCID